MKSYVLLNTKKRNAKLMTCLFSLIMLILSTISFAQNEKIGVLAFETEQIDYGTIMQHDDGVRTFSFKNEGNAPLVISKVKTSCGCTVPTYPKQAILPGETASIEIKYDTKRTGPFTKTITVISNATEAQKKLVIKGNVVVKPS